MPEPEIVNLGTCCVCEGVEGVRNILTLHQKSPTPDEGAWGCFNCGLSHNGAMAVVCDDCLKKPLRFACHGKLGRIPVEQLKGYHLHDLSKHFELHQTPEILYTEIHWFKESPDEGHPLCLCSWCGHLIPAIDDEEEDAEEHEIAIRMWNGRNEEARFHHSCLERVLNLGVFTVNHDPSTSEPSCARN